MHGAGAHREGVVPWTEGGNENVRRRGGSRGPKTGSIHPGHDTGEWESPISIHPHLDLSHPPWMEVQVNKAAAKRPTLQSQKERVLHPTRKEDGAAVPVLDEKEKRTVVGQGHLVLK